jgi:hypothetical protein
LYCHALRNPLAVAVRAMGSELDVMLAERGGEPAAFLLCSVQARQSNQRDRVVDVGRQFKAQ